MIESVFGWSEEYRNWGLNLLTIAAVVTFFFTAVQGWELLRQSRAIWEKESGESVSVTWMSLFCFVFITFSIYGLHRGGLALFLNGLLGLLHFPILLGLWKFKRIAVTEYIVAFICMLMVPAMALLPFKQVLLTLFMGTGNCSILTQGIEIVRKKNVGVVNIRLIWTYLLSTGFWITYAAALGDHVLMSLMIMAFLFLSFNTYAYYTYRNSADGGVNKQADPLF